MDALSARRADLDAEEPVVGRDRRRCRRHRRRRRPAHDPGLPGPHHRPSGRAGPGHAQGRGRQHRRHRAHRRDRRRCRRGPRRRPGAPPVPGPRPREGEVVTRWSRCPSIDIVLLIAGLAFYLFVLGTQLARIATNLEECAELVRTIARNAEVIRPGVEHINRTGRRRGRRAPAAVRDGRGHRRRRHPASRAAGPAAAGPARPPAAAGPGCTTASATSRWPSGTGGLAGQWPSGTRSRRGRARW